MYFKEATISDAPIIHKLMIKAFSEYKNDEITSSALEETENSISVALLEKGEKALIAYESDEPVAMARFKIDHYKMNFYRLFVDPLYQGNGVGKYLLKSLEIYAKNKGVSEIICKVRMNIKRNVSLYKDIGYFIFDNYTIDKPNNESLHIVSMKKFI
ncbi:GNAT family N-acetyltransferase [Staphylococcus xylosus]|uniref:GNAT family N-acetyltransferase n=1 Tax=Staphylococcus xylosus TaxID=1288 RepID=A0A5R9B779_STAXY|nr:GNAT family N-acetyltransferase [Staphylococcus xylosus]MEB7755826.1 GNAT family N-acetyltransferase [Staphylococcus xylosus]MEB7797614.1 GNAT family N-acetyltransferase [Staphylococcus xylosus]MEB8146883.1 GNAT family N-acetyltransferase [Staphylococcus xylosus]PTH91247.1 GNAT family N-acetyltransferase [Staphylococcus xylosus]QDW89260.1 GNAT family N-acetyltransferase [Staphylococcus xylosus]